MYHSSLFLLFFFRIEAGEVENMNSPSCGVRRAAALAFLLFSVGGAKRASCSHEGAFFEEVQAALSHAESANDDIFYLYSADSSKAATHTEASKTSSIFPLADETSSSIPSPISPEIAAAERRTAAAAATAAAEAEAAFATPVEYLRRPPSVQLQDKPQGPPVLKIKGQTLIRVGVILVLIGLSIAGNGYTNSNKDRNLSRMHASRETCIQRSR